MKRALYFVAAFFVAFGVFAGTKAERAYSETPVIPVEEDANVYLDQIVQVPSADDSRWKLVPKEEMATELQFLVDQQNSNYQRIRTWKGTYYQIRKKDLSGLDETHFANRSAIPSKLLYTDPRMKLHFSETFK